MSANGTSLKSDVVEFIACLAGDQVPAGTSSPVLLAIKYPRPKIVQGRYGERAMFTLTDGRVCFLDLGVAEKIAAAAVRTGEPFWINCKWDGKKGSPRIWEVWLDVNAEKTRAAEESDPFSAVRAGIKRAVDRTFGAQQDGTFAVPATSPPRQVAPPIDRSRFRPRNSNGSFASRPNSSN